MANITKEGIVPDKRPHSTTCHVCGTVFTFLEGESTEVQGVPKHILMQIPCPTEDCGSPVYHYNKYHPIPGMAVR